MSDKIRIFPLGDCGLTVEFGNVISPDLNAKAIALSNVLQANGFPGFIEAVPAYASTTIFYDVIRVRKEYSQFQTAFEAVKDLALSLSDQLGEGATAAIRTVEVPVHFDADSAPDLDLVAEKSGVSANEVIKIFTAKTYRVYMLGFLPGFTYMGEVDERIAVPRKETPRTLVPKGSVGIAGKQTGVYSLASPGGWQIIGRTEVEMFTPGGEEPTYFKPGDEVRFVPV